MDENMDVLLELTIVVAVIAFVVLVGALVATIMQIKTTLVQAEKLLGHLNKETPLLLSNLHEISSNVRDVTHKTREGMTHAMVLVHAIGDIGHTVKKMHLAVLDQGERLLNTFDSVKRGIKRGFESTQHRNTYDTKSFQEDDRPQSPVKNMVKAYLGMIVTQALRKLLFGTEPDRAPVRQPQQNTGIRPTGGRKVS
ncbi:MAG: hypothetical protein NPIRA04_06550 [Nitrospirales bacterium]|nr:MAG: hypothetical protein NPIRA04_06550 [Nitrospirales bacterium]